VPSASDVSGPHPWQVRAVCVVQRITLRGRRIRRRAHGSRHGCGPARSVSSIDRSNASRLILSTRHGRSAQLFRPGSCGGKVVDTVSTSSLGIGPGPRRRLPAHRRGPLVDLVQSAESPQDVPQTPSAANGYQRANVQVTALVGASAQVSGGPRCEYPQIRRSREHARRAGRPRHVDPVCGDLPRRLRRRGLNVLVAGGTQASTPIEPLGAAARIAA
jgi:hypothetical protein